MVTCRSPALSTPHRFRVVALGLPVPRYPGNTLDPPFRSRFQARDVPSATAATQLRALCAAAPEADQAS